MEVWTIHAKERDGGYSIVSPEGESVGSYADEQSGRAHHAMAMAENIKLKKALRVALSVMEKGIAVRIDDQWPALKKILPEAIKQASDLLDFKP